MFGKTYPLHLIVYNSSFVFNGSATTEEDKNISKEALNALITAGAHVSARNSRGETPLHIATKRNNFYAATLLLDNHAKVIPRDGKGKTPLDYAESGEMIKLLKENGAKELL